MTAENDSAGTRRAPALLLCLLLITAAGHAAELTLETDPATLSGLPLEVTVGVQDLGAGETAEVTVTLAGEVVERSLLEVGTHRLRLGDLGLAPGRYPVMVEGGGQAARGEIRVIPAWLSIVPPLIAIVLAVAFRDVLVSLFAGVYCGALFLFGWNPFLAFARSIDRFIAPALADGDHAAIIIFSSLLGGMVGLISKSGGTQGIVESLKAYATTARRGQVATWVLGVLVFFDDYANALIVGPTMRPITDRLRVSREKLAYIVDSTAAPVASVIPISTWIGFEVGLIAAAFTQLGLPFNAYTTLVASILYRFYPIFALVLGFTIAFSCRDFGPMLKAELRASETGEVISEDGVPLADYNAERLTPPAGAPRRAVNALLPIAAVVVVTLLGLFLTGRGAVDRAAFGSDGRWLQEVFSNADSFAALLWASLAGVVVALVLAIAQRILTVRESMEALVEGMKSMFLALVVLILAWSIGGVCEQLRTADFVVGLTEGVLSPHWLPVLVFVLSALISFATGTSWGTMAILMPLVIPICHGLAVGAGHSPETHAYYVYMLGTISSVLAGSVWGDHCSPISDTTILSSMASGCDHIAHVRTQLPYALAVGILGMLLGDIPTAFGLSPWISLLVGSVVIVAAVLWRGRRSDWRGARAGTGGGE